MPASSPYVFVVIVRSIKIGMPQVKNIYIYVYIDIYVYIMIIRLG